MPYRIERLCPARADDYLAFFDHEQGPAFSDNPEWATCYCHYYEVPVSLAWKDFDGSMNRVAMRARIETAEMEGFLAYDGDEVVGWMNAQPYHKLTFACARMRIPEPPLPVARHEAAAVVCFVVAPSHRRRGIARALLDAGLGSFAERGIRLVDGFPWNVSEGDDKPADFYHGSASMFAAAGFVTLAAHEKVTVVRKIL
jgi:ribosomal protein S18 acetylase RimI-like enzyme